MTHSNKITPSPLWPYPAFAPFLPWTPVQPDLYWNTESPERALLELCRNLEKLIQYAEGIGINVNELRGFYDELNAKFDDLVEGGLVDYYAEQVQQWINDNLEFIFTHVVKMVFFGLTDDGYFCAYIPTNWAQEIEFDTGAVYGQFDYGRLILRYNADGSGVIDNTGRYDDRYTSLERRVAHNENTLYSPMRNGGIV